MRTLQSESPDLFAPVVKETNKLEISNLKGIIEDLKDDLLREARNNQRVIQGLESE